MLLLSQCCFFAILGHVAFAKPFGDKIEHLQGLNLDLGFDQYAGYVDGGGNETSRNNIFYFLTEYQMEDTDNISVMLWLNGGPGCSSLGGLMTELGPLRPNKDGKTLQENVYAWNKVGHVVHFESPPGVGFSYADDGNEQWDDDTTSEVNVNALNDFFKKFPEFSKRKFFITGESYAGVYLPTLAQRIKEWTIAGNFSNPNFQGMAIGNGELDGKMLYNSAINYYYGHGFFGDEQWTDVRTACCGGPDSNGETCDFYSPLFDSTPVVDTINSSACANASYAAYLSMEGIPDIYNVYQSCYEYQHLNVLAEHSFVELRSALTMHLDEEKADHVIAKISRRTRPNYDSSDGLNGLPCYVDDANQEYLNDPDVLRALHVAPAWIAKNITWTDCNLPLNENYNRTYGSMADQFEYLLQPFTTPGSTDERRLRLMTYNGDVDIACNFLGDQWFGHAVAEKNNLTKLQRHSSWLFDGMLAGFQERFDNYDILTVNGAGHFVPMDRAGPALQMIANFVWNTKNYTKPTGIDVTPRKPVVMTHPDKIINLPGVPYQLQFDQYSGYLDGGKTSDGAKNNLFYWLTKYQGRDYDDIPVILWLNGGPGCSSLGGLFTENGPFYANEDGKTLFENVYGWNKVGHVLYLESPPGVGFSYNDNFHESWNDDDVALMNTLALEDFFVNRYPEFANRTFYITGESYGGIYIPTLSQSVVEGIAAGTFTNTKFAGLAIGNGCMDWENIQNAIVDMAYLHGFFGQYEWLELREACCPEMANMSAKSCDFVRGPNLNEPHQTEKCLDVYRTLYQGVLYTVRDTFDPYNMYQSCYAKNAMKNMIAQQSHYNGGSTNNLDGFACFGASANKKYLERPDVQKAIHVSEKYIKHAKGHWSDCVYETLPFNYTQTYTDMHAQFDFLLKPFTPAGSTTEQTLNLMMYNGDVDYVCNFLGDEWFAHDVVADNNLTETMAGRNNWRYSFNLGGTQQLFMSNSGSKFDVLTVNGAGHFVPMDRPGPALQMISNFIKNTGNYSIPTSIDLRPIPYDSYVYTESECPAATTASHAMSTAMASVMLSAVAAVCWIII